jgi:ADP-ribose pyrophosphatase YjhB (NUDIX family)
MTTYRVPRWLAWAREIQALSQTGLTFSENDYERQRYTRLAEIAAEIMHSYTGLPAADLTANFLEQPGYATPKIDVRGAVVRDGKVLLVQERVDERWCMPGGWADVGDRPSETVAREVWEESGFHIVPRTVVGVYDANRSGRPLPLYHAYKIVFWCEITGGEARTSDETLAVGFFPFDDLPPLSSNRTDQRHLADVQAHAQDPQRPAHFD